MASTQHEWPYSTASPLNQHQTGVTLQGKWPHFFLKVEKEDFCCHSMGLLWQSLRDTLGTTGLLLCFTGIFLPFPSLLWRVQSAGMIQLLNIHQIFHFGMGSSSPETFLQPSVTLQVANCTTPFQWAWTKTEDLSLGSSAWRRLSRFTCRTGTTDCFWLCLFQIALLKKQHKL